MMMSGEAMAVDGSDDVEEDVVPTVFRWEHGGRQVRRVGARVAARVGEGVRAPRRRVADSDSCPDHAPNPKP